MERPFHYGNAYEQQIASMLSTINAMCMLKTLCLAAI